MSTLRARLACTWDVIRVIPRHPQLIPMMAFQIATHVFIVVGCWWTGRKIDDLRREVHRRERLQLLTGGSPLALSVAEFG
jgi:hypothetical protein